MVQNVSSLSLSFYSIYSQNSYPNNCSVSRLWRVEALCIQTMVDSDANWKSLNIIGESYINRTNVFLKGVTRYEHAKC